MSIITRDEHICHHSHSIFLDNFIRRIFQNPGKIVGEYISDGDTVLELGCGPGFFTIDMAKIVGDRGKVIAVDLQQEMLERVKKKALNKKVMNRISLHRCDENSLGLDPEIKADFILAYYMIHETPDPQKFIVEVMKHLNYNGKLLIVEPKFHVTEGSFNEMVEFIESVGYHIEDRPKNKGGRSLVISK